MDTLSDIVISVKNLSKVYLIGHKYSKKEKYASLRGVIVKNISDLFRKTMDMIHGRQLVQGDEVEEFYALKDVSFNINRGDRVGILGRNGAGKSTLLKILSRITEPTNGQVKIQGRIASLLEVGTGFHQELSGRENIYLNGAILGMNRSEIDAKFSEIVEFSEVEKFIDTPVKHYSSGMYMRLAFSVAAHLESEILIVDEVLAVGDVNFQKKCLGKLDEISNEGRTVLYVSHNIESIKKLCNVGILMSNGSLVDINDIDSIIERYTNYNADGDGQNPIYFKKRKNLNEYYIDRIEILDESYKLKDKIFTWDNVIFRVYFHSPVEKKYAGVMLKISTPSGFPVTTVSTREDQSYETSFKMGENFVDCLIKNIPLSSGNYLIGGALTVPFTEWLSHQFDEAILNIHSKDIYSSAVVPSNQRYIVPMDVQWKSNL